MVTAVALCVACSYTRSGDAVAQVPAAPGTELPAFGEGEDIVRHTGYTASYNHTTLCPDWVAWELTAEETRGSHEQQRLFSRDPDVSFPKASREDYSRSGWDKGHMAPHADMKWSLQALTESDYFTNICPQDKVMNAQAWRKIEELTRRLAQHYGAVYVVCGPIYDSAERRHIGEACVHVPDRFYKALAVNTSDGWQTVAFVVENNRQTFGPRHYAVSVDSVEALVAASRGVATDLFPTLPEEAEQAFDWKYWNR